MLTKIIAFSGRKQSGKSTSGEYILQLINSINKNIKVKIYSFADPLKKNICMDLLGLTEKQCYGSDEDKNTITNILWENMPDFDPLSDNTGYMTAREVMEVVGTKIFRKIKDDVWIKSTLDKIQEESPDIALLLDNRFPNEVDAILDIGGYVIRLDRNPFNAQTKPEIALDPNNYDWNKFSYVLKNHLISIEEKNNLIYQFLYNKGLLSL
jgi:hypothetical protein